MMEDITLFLDLEGTIYTRGGVIDGALEALKELRGGGATLRFLTNTDSQSTESIIIRAASIGVDIREGELFTPVSAVKAYLYDNPDALIFPLTTEAVANELAESLTLVDDPAVATHTVIGDIRTTLEYPILDAAFQSVFGGAELIALQRGKYFLSDGRAHLDTGGIVAAIEYAAGKPATVVGKPNRAFLELAALSIDNQPPLEKCWVVGDDATTDIPMGKSAGMNTVQVMTGKSSLYSTSQVSDADYQIESLSYLPKLIGEII